MALTFANLSPCGLPSYQEARVSVVPCGWVLNDRNLRSSLWALTGDAHIQMPSLVRLPGSRIDLVQRVNARYLISMSSNKQPPKL